MKKIFTALIAFGLVATAANAAVATSELPQVAITPGHPLYDIKTMTEKDVEELAPNSSAKAKAKLSQANKRAAEMKQLADANKTELANETAKAYASEMQGLQQLGDSISDLAQQRQINELVAQATSFHTEVLNTVFQKVPEQAKAGISKALNQSVTGHRKAVASLNKTGDIPAGIGNVSEHIPSSLKGKMGGPTGRPGGSGQGQPQDTGNETNETGSPPGAP